MRAALHLPDRYFSRVSCIRIREDLLDEGVRLVMLDMDNTILSREDGLVPRDALAWLRSVEAAGIRALIVSNNWHARPYEVGVELGLSVVAKAMKPLPFAFMAARRGFERRESLVIGDQVTTDVLGAHLAGIRAYLVAPLSEADLRHMAVVRRLEALMLGARVPEGAHAAAGAAILDPLASGPDARIRPVSGEGEA